MYISILLHIKSSLSFFSYIVSEWVSDSHYWYLYVLLSGVPHHGLLCFVCGTLLQLISTAGVSLEPYPQPPDPTHVPTTGKGGGKSGSKPTLQKPSEQPEVLHNESTEPPLSDSYIEPTTSVCKHINPALQGISPKEQQTVDNTLAALMTAEGTHAVLKVFHTMYKHSVHVALLGIQCCVHVHVSGIVLCRLYITICLSQLVVPMQLSMQTWRHVYLQAN